MDDLLLLRTAACTQGKCGNCFKGHDHEGGWCECFCHPLPPLSAAMRRWLKVKFWLTVPTTFVQAYRVCRHWTDNLKGDVRRAWRITMGKDDI